jgi:hypothetical protein
MSFKPRSSPSIRHAIRMLAAVDLDDETMPDRHEIDDIRSDWALAAKFVVRQPAIA